jgi:hypothetical protein
MGMRLLLRGGVLLDAVGAVLAHQALGQDPDEGRGDEEVGDTEVQEARDGRRGVVGVQGGEDEVAGEGGLDGVLGGLGVPDLAHHDDVGVLAQDRAQGAGERDLDLGPHRHLVEVLVHHLDRVLDRDDVDVRLGEVLQHRVERGRLAAARRSRDQDDPGGSRDEVVELGQVVGGEPQLVDPLQEDVGVEDAQHPLLPEGRGHGGDADLDLAAALLALDAPVLRAPLLGQVAPGEELDARHHRPVHDLGDEVDVVQDAVDAQAHQRQLALGLEVDVGGPLLEGVAQDVVQGLHHRRRRRVHLLVGGGEELLVPQVDRGEPAGRELLLRRLQAGLEVVEPLVDGLDVAAGGHHLRHVQPGHALDVVRGERREGIDDGYGDGVGGLGDGHQAVAPGERPGQGLGHDVEVQVERVDLHVGQAGVGGQGLGDLDLAGQAELDHRLLRRHVVDARGPLGPLCLLGRQHLPLHQDGEELG